jgi:hypothetical protein
MQARWYAAIIALLFGVPVVLAVLTAISWDDRTLKAASSIDVNGEGGIAAWWSSTLLTLAAAAAFVCGACQLAWRRRAARWLLLGAGLLWLSLEETAGIHERVGKRLTLSETEGNVSDWTIVYLPLLLAGASVLVSVLRELSARERRLVGAGLTCFVLVVAIELAAIWTDGSLPEILVEEVADLVGQALVLLGLGGTAVRRVRAAFDGSDGDAQGADSGSSSQAPPSHALQLRE